MFRLFAVVYLLLSFQVFGIQIGKIQWGFNNKVKKHTFNFVTFEVMNDSPTVYDSYIALEPDGMGVQTSLHKKLFLNPGQRKIVQFSCYIDHSDDNWTVKWEGGKSYIDKAPESNGSFIYLNQGFSAIRLNRGINLMQDSLFPATVTLTDDLDGLALDHNPDWSPKQKEAFMDWLRKGGAVFIINDRSGSQPKFTSIMSDLNNPDSKFHIGNGMVEREKVSITSFEKPYVNTTERINEYTPNSNEYFQALQYLVKTDHNWTLIYFLIFVYLIVIGPVNYLIGKKTRDWKVPNLFFLIAVIGFSILFSVIGRRGYGEQTKLTSVSLADVIEEDKYDVQQWTNIFVTSGDLYNLTHNGSPNQYYSFSEIGKKTMIDADTGTFTADIPLFSSRRMIHRAKLDGPKINAEIVPGKGVNSTAVKLTAPELNIDKVWIVKNGNVYRTSKSSGIYEETSPIEAYYGNNYYGNDYTDAYEEIEKMLVSRLQLSRKTLFNSYTDTKLNKHIVYAVVRAKTPKNFHFSDGNIPGEESGWTYFRIYINTDRAN
ncbi:MAG: hypothetical protein NE328_07755 [Lentisphaeraceae bacterium]|nr:hypothetical protein [Lentisphaeraceae bacterium]